MAMRDFLGMKTKSLRRTERDFYVVYPLGKRLQIGFATQKQDEAQTARGRVSQASIFTITITLAYFLANLGGDLTLERGLGYLGILCAYLVGAVLYVRSSFKEPQFYNAARHGKVIKTAL